MSVCFVCPYVCIPYVCLSVCPYVHPDAPAPSPRSGPWCEKRKNEVCKGIASDCRPDDKTEIFNLHSLFIGPAKKRALNFSEKREKELYEKREQYQLVLRIYRKTDPEMKSHKSNPADNYEKGRH